MSTSGPEPSTVEIPISDLAELVVEAWRLDRHFAARSGDTVPAAWRHAARRLGDFLAKQGFTVLDLTGRSYDPGLAVLVVDVVEDPGVPTDQAVIEEMLAPIVLWRGAVARPGQVVVRQPPPMARSGGQS